MYDSWYIKVQQREFFVILGHFLLFHPPPPPEDKENQNFGKLKKKPRDIIILHMCTINDNHLKYGSWDMEHNRQNFFSHFGPFLSLYHKSKFWKTEKNGWRYYHFTQVYQKSWQYATLFLRYGTCRCNFLHSIWGHFLPFYPHNNPKNIN